MPVAGAGGGAPRLSHLRIPRSTAPGSAAPRPGPRRPGNGTGGSPGAGPTGSPETREMPESAIAGGMRSAAIAGGCLVAAVGLVVMAGWVTGVAVLTSVLPTPGRIFFNTAFGAVRMLIRPTGPIGCGTAVVSSPRWVVVIVGVGVVALAVCGLHMTCR